MSTIINYTIARDVNGNKVCKVKPAIHRGFSIQTNGNLPETDRRGVCDATAREVLDYVTHYGTEKQRQAMRQAWRADK